MLNQPRIKVVWRAAKGTFVVRYFDENKGPFGGWREQSCKTKDRKLADKKAGKLAEKLESGQFHVKSRITWDDFVLKYRAEKLSSLAAKTKESFDTAANHLGRILSPKKLVDLTPAALSHFQSKIRCEVDEDGNEIRRSEDTVASYLRSIRAALSWAVEVGLLRSVPKIVMPKRVKGEDRMRGRPVTEQEFARMVKVCRKEHPDNFRRWRRYLTGLYLSGLRLQESLALSWEASSPFSIDLSGKYPRFKIRGGAEKGNKDRLLPMAPEFARFLLETPTDRRRGRVFKVRLSPRRVSEAVSSIGRRAKIIVDAVEGRHATAHDLRRSFGTRWAMRIPPAVLQVLMRHRSIETTMKYYVGLNADEVAEKVWSVWTALGLESPNSQPKKTVQSDLSGDLDREAVTD